FETGLPSYVVVEVRVAAVDDRVARLEVLEQLDDLSLRRIAGRDHDPDRPPLCQRGDQLGDRERRFGSLAGDLLGLLRSPVIDDDLVTIAPGPADHVGPHPPETDNPELHRFRPPWALPGPPRALVQGRQGPHPDRHRGAP